MKSTDSAFLKADILAEDIRKICLWLKNPSVTKYLHEDDDIVPKLAGLLAHTPEPMLAYHLNQFGRFHIVCTEDRGAIGFIKLHPGRDGSFELVIVIGDESLWGKGYGRQTLQAVLKTVFFVQRSQKLTAKVYHGNNRSVGLVQGCGLKLEKRLEKLDCYSITMSEYLEQARSPQSPRMRIA